MTQGSNTHQVWDICVIGAGLSGASAAWHIARFGLKTLVVDAGLSGARGATAATGAIVRGFDPTPALQRLNLLGNRLLLNWQTEGYPGATPFQKRGFIWRFDQENELKIALQKWLELCDRENHSCETLTSQIAESRWTELSQFNNKPSGLVLWEPNAGTLNARQLVSQLISDLKNNGHAVLEHTPIEAIEKTSDGWVLHHAFGYIKTRLLILANGVDAARLWTTLSLTSKNISVSVYTNRQKNKMPALIDEGVGSYFCPVGEHMLLVGTKGLNPAHTPASEIKAQTDSYLQAAFKQTDQWQFTGICSADDAYTSDNLPIISPLYNHAQKPVGNLFALTGCSGLGAKFSLAAGQLIANMVVRQDTPPEWAASFSAHRFIKFAQKEAI